MKKKKKMIDDGTQLDGEETAANKKSSTKNA